MTKHNEVLGVIGRGRGSNIGVVLSDVATSRGRGVDGLSGVLNVGNVAVGVVGGVGDSLDPAVGKRNRVRTADNTVGIASLSSVEVGLGVVVGNGVVVGVGGDLVGVHLSNGVGNGVGNTVGSKKLGGGRGRSHKGKGDEGLE